MLTHDGAEKYRTSDQREEMSTIQLACSAGVLLVRANAKSSRPFVRPAIIDLQLE